MTDIETTIIAINNEKEEQIRKNKIIQFLSLLSGFERFLFLIMIMSGIYLITYVIYLSYHYIPIGCVIKDIGCIEKNVCRDIYDIHCDEWNCQTTYLYSFYDDLYNTTEISSSYNTKNECKKYCIGYRTDTCYIDKKNKNNVLQDNQIYLIYFSSMLFIITSLIICIKFSKEVVLPNNYQKIR